MKFDKDCEVIWRDRKRFLGMPLSFTRYYIVKKEGEWLKMFSDKGLLTSTIEEVNIYRCFDVSMKASLGERMFGTGTIHIQANDDSTPDIYIRSVKNPYKVRDLISSLIEIERKKKKIGITEFQ